MTNLKTIFPTWENMWQGYTKNFMDPTYVKNLGQKSIHITVLDSVYNYWKNDEFNDDEESSVNKIMIMIRAESTLLSQNKLLYQNVYENLKLPVSHYQKVQKSFREDLAPHYRRHTATPASKIPSSKTVNIQHMGLQYPTRTDETIQLPKQQIDISEGRKETNKTWTDEWLPLDRNWIARLVNSFSAAKIDLAEIVKSFHPYFASTYALEGKYIYDENTKEYRWKSKRNYVDLETDEETGKPIVDEDLRELGEDEYNQLKEEGKDLKPTWFLEKTYRRLGRDKKELKKLAGTSKLKKEEQIEALENLIKIYEKTYERPTLNYFVDTLEEEIEGYEELKTLVRNYFVNLLNPTKFPIRPLSFILAGPPGTGKSAIAKAVAKASKRSLITIPMNGQAEITYLKGREIAYGGATKGKLLEEILTRESSQPVVLIDELTRAGAEGLINAVGQMTDPDQNHYIFEDDWLKHRLDLSQFFFLIADNEIGRIPGFLLSRSQVVKVQILSYAKRIEVVLKQIAKTLGGENETKNYVGKFNKDFCQYIITEELGLRQTLANVTSLFLALRANVLLGKPIVDVNDIVEVKKEELSYTLIYPEGQKIILVRAYDEEKGLDGIVHNVFTDVPDWPGATPHNHQDERTKINSLDLKFQGLYNFDFTRYPELEELNISNNNFDDLDLRGNTKLVSLNIENNSDLPFCYIEFGNCKNILEELYFSGIYGNNEEIKLQDFPQLKKIGYDWKVKAIYLDKDLENNVKRVYTAWEELSDDDKLLYQTNYPNTIYEEVMKGKVTYL